MDEKNSVQIPTLQPNVDIYETQDGITLVADMPGVPKEKLNLHIENDTLLIEGDIDLDLPEEIEPLHADVTAGRYQRSFTLSSELESSAIEASLKDGVLNIHIPKRVEARPKKIEVRFDG